jgi:uncharacterized protein (DUF58 family)
LVALILGLFLQAYMHNFNIVYISLFFLVGFGVVAEFIGRRNISRVELSLLACGRIFARSGSEYTLRLSNPDKAPLYAIEVHNGVSHKAVHRIGAHRSATVRLETGFETRGEARLPDTELISYYPLPHLRFGKRFVMERDVVVLPEPWGEPLAAFLARNRSAAGERDDFDGVRRYESGDGASLIYWPSVAKGETVMSKQFLFEEPTRKLRFDFAALEGDDEVRLSQLTLWVLEAERAGLEFAVILNGRELDAAQGGVDGILETLARY